MLYPQDVGLTKDCNEVLKNPNIKQVRYFVLSLHKLERVDNDTVLIYAVRVSRFYTFFSRTLSLYDLQGANRHRNP